MNPISSYTNYDPTKDVNVNGNGGQEGGGSYNSPSEGVYICKIVGCEERRGRNNPNVHYLAVDLDIIQDQYGSTEFANYYTNRHNRFPDGNWGCVLSVFLPPEQIQSEKDQWTLNAFKNFVRAVEVSNPGYEWDWMESGLIGKIIGCSFRMEEYPRGHWRAKPAYAYSTEYVEQGKARIPKRKAMRPDQPDPPQTLYNRNNNGGQNNQGGYNTPNNQGGYNGPNGQNGYVPQNGQNGYMPVNQGYNASPNGAGYNNNGYNSNGNNNYGTPNNGNMSGQNGGYNSNPTPAQNPAPNPNPNPGGFANTNGYVDGGQDSGSQQSVNNIPGYGNVSPTPNGSPNPQSDHPSDNFGGDSNKGSGLEPEADAFSELTGDDDLPF